MLENLACETPKVWSIASGSKANCTLIAGTKSKILIDFGVSCRYAKNALAEFGYTFDDIDAIFITHEHIDHVGGLKTLAKYYNVPVHMTQPSFMHYRKYADADVCRNIIVHDSLYFNENVGGFSISSFAVSHDSAACVGYSILHESGYRIGLCTDIGEVTERISTELRACDIVVIESNHDENMLYNGPYPEILKDRISSRFGHLSNRDCGKLLIDLALSGVKKVFLAHLSEINNTPNVALLTALTILNKNNLAFDVIDIMPPKQVKLLG